MASVLRWAVVYWTLTQVIILRGASGSPVHIQLNVDGKDEAIKITGLIKIRYNPKDAATPVYTNTVQRDLVEKAGLIKLYVRGKFIELDNNRDENVNFNWDNIRISGKELGEFILRIFNGDPVVIVVFPNDLQTPHGFQFQKEFEEVVQRTNDRITVGRGVINVYLGFALQNLDGKKTLLEANVPEYEKDEKYYSIFANYYSNAFSFRTVFTAWRTELRPVNIFRVKIQEADSVVVKLISVCTSDQNGLKVGSHTAQGLADILFKLLRVQDVETHPQQRIRVELPDSCGTAKEREAFTGDLVDNLENKKLKVYGKEPSVHIHVYSDDDTDDTNDIKTLHPRDIFGKIKGQISLDQNQKSAPTTVSSAKELFIHIHCHGVFSGNGKTICRKDSDSLAGILSEFVKTLLINSVPKKGIIMFHVCEAGSEHGQEYVNKFLTNFDKSLQTLQIYIQESLAYQHRVGLIMGNTMASLPCSKEPDPKLWPMAHEKQVFGRFTVRTIKTAQGFKAFSLLPLTEYNLIYKK